MRKLIFIIIALYISASTQADDQPVKTNEPFMLAEVKIFAPKADRWFLLPTQKNKIAFISEVDGHLKTAQVSLFSIPGEYQKDSFIAMLKSNINKMGKIISESYSFSDIKGYPCAKAATTSDMGKDGKALLVQFRVTACIAPTYQQQGVMAAFSYSSDKPVQRFDAQADAFFEKIEIPLVKINPAKEDLKADSCTTGSGQLIEFMRSKGNGLTQEGALKAAKQNLNNVVISAESINNLYKYPKLDADGHYGYYLWACVTRKEGRKPLPLSETLAEEINACFKKKGDDTCGKQISDKVKAGT